MKLSYSQLLNIVLVAILATSMFLMNTRSTMETKTAQAGTYDPWLDYNEDGYIGIDDIYTTASSFGAEGDPTKNVNVTNWPSQKHDYDFQYLGRVTWNDTDGYRNFTDVFCGGRSKIIPIISIVDMSLGNYNITISLISIYWISHDPEVGFVDATPSSILQECNQYGRSWPDAWGTSNGNSFAIEVKGEYARLWFGYTASQPNGWSVSFDVYVYLRNE